MSFQDFQMVAFPQLQDLDATAGMDKRPDAKPGTPFRPIHRRMFSENMLHLIIKWLTIKQEN